MDHQYDFSKNNFHVAPGDVLLLRSSDKGIANRAGQWVKRSREVRFTHVAVVVDLTKIVDAMPKVGVSLRLWRDIERKYDIKRSVVARHAGLANDLKVRGLVYRSGLYFVKQPYKLTTALRDSGSIRDQSGLVCSHFVAAIMRRLGLRISEQRDTATLPVDIDAFTRASPDWRQFGLEEYGLYSRAARPHLSDPYWAALHEANLSQLSDEDRAALQRPTTAPAIEVPTTLEGIQDWLEKSDDVLRRSQEVNQQIEDKFRETTELQHSISRDLVQCFVLFRT